MSDAKSTRDTVADAYARAVTDGGGCCGGGQKGAVVALAGYDQNALQALPDDAISNSFGCGDPTAFAHVQAGEVVLDLGSGAGIDLLLAAQKVGPTGSVIGVDMTPEMIERARANIAAAGLSNVEVRQGIIEELPVEDHSVDWVISNCVINLSPEKERVFAEIARVLKPGGRISVSDIVVEDLPGELREVAAVYTSCVGGAISEQEYVAGLEAAGLTNVSVDARLVYDQAALRGLIQSEVEGEVAPSSCCGDTSADDVRNLLATVPGIAAEVEGKVWSARFSARRR